MGEHEGALVRATCASCGAAFRIRTREQACTCTKCGGVVRAAPSEPRVPPGEDLLAACIACRAVLPLGVRHCPECGRDSHAGDAAVPPPTARERQLASRELHEASRAIEFVRNVLWVPTILFFLLSLAPLLALTDPRVPMPVVLVLVGVYLLPLVFCLIAVTRIALNPFAWTLGIAVLSTLVFVNQLTGVAIAGHLGSLRLVITGADALIVLGLWLSVPSMIRVRRLLRLHPGAFAARALLGVVASRDVGAEELQRIAALAAWKRAGVYVAIAAGIVALTVAVVWTEFRPRPLERTLDAFTEAWNRSDLDGVVAFVAIDRSTAERARLEKVRAARAWSSLPPLVPATGAVLGALEGPQEVRLHLRDRDECVTSVWARSGAAWELTRLDLPPPPIGPEVEVFTRAWNASDVEGLSDLFAESSRARFRAYFDRLIHLRGWTKGFPKVAAENTNPRGPSDADVWMTTERDRFLTLWHLDEDDHWVLVSVEAPKH
jgi:hypothetical protein